MSSTLDEILQNGFGGIGTSQYQNMSGDALEKPPGLRYSYQERFHIQRIYDKFAFQHRKNANNGWMLFLRIYSKKKMLCQNYDSIVSAFQQWIFWIHETFIQSDGEWTVRNIANVFSSDILANLIEKYLMAFQ